MIQNLFPVDTILFGALNSGKSTLLANLMSLAGESNKNSLRNYPKVVEPDPNDPLEFSWALNDLKTRLEIRSYVEGPYSFETKSYKFCIRDVSGNKNFLSNIIKSYSVENLAIFVISAAQENQDDGGLVARQLKMASLFKNLIICVNKMDHQDVEWSKKRFNEIVREMSGLLDFFGHDSKKVTFVPISSLANENLISKSKKMDWYKEDCLLDILQNMKYYNTDEERAKMPLRVTIINSSNNQQHGPLAYGKVEYGVFNQGSVVRIAPGNLKGTVELFNGKQSTLAGNYRSFKVKGINMDHLGKGMILGEDQGNPPFDCVSFKALITIVSKEYILEEGHELDILIHSDTCVCKFVEFEEKVDRRNGSLKEKEPKKLKYGNFAIVKMKPEKPLCVEAFRDYSKYGRFIVAHEKKYVAIGVILSVEKEETNK